MKAPPQLPARRCKPHLRNLRIGRYSIRNQVYLVTFATLHRERVFDDLPMARIVVRGLNVSTDIRTLAFVVMPDHVHWLLQLKGEKSLSRVIQTTKIVTAKALNKARNACGPVWQAGFHDRAARTEQDIKGMARYLVANPVRAGLVQSVREYPHWDAIWL